MAEKYIVLLENSDGISALAHDNIGDALKCYIKWMASDSKPILVQELPVSIVANNYSLTVGLDPAPTKINLEQRKVLEERFGRDSLYGLLPEHLLKIYNVLMEAEQ